MCGIVGFLDRTGGERQTLGQVLLKMLTALGCRGPDSAGVALYGNPAASGVVVRVKLGERGAFDEKGQQVAERVRSLASLSEFSTKAEYLAIRKPWRVRSKPSTAGWRL